MHIYAFGSVCRGDVIAGSDIDLLAIVEGFDSRFEPEAYSIYSYNRLRDLWQEGNPFAWHLSLESRLIFSSENNDFLKSLDTPSAYKNCKRDCHKFYSLFKEAKESITNGGNSRIFDLSTVFLSIRNIATCYSLEMTAKPDFSRNAALRLEQESLAITNESYDIFLRSRVLCTRGYGASISDQEFRMAISKLDEIEHGMGLLLIRVDSDERIQ